MGKTGVLIPKSMPSDFLKEEASLIYPDGGPYLLTFNNFKVIMLWNRSTYYAGTVDYLARKVCANRSAY